MKAAIGKGDKSFVIAPGDYRFGSEQLPNLLIEAHDLDINATGVNLWFNGHIRQDGIAFKNCRNVRFHGATLDYDPFCRYSQGEILSINPDTKTVVIRVDPGFPLPEPNWFKRVGDIKAVFYDPQGYVSPNDVRLGERRCSYP